MPAFVHLNCRCDNSSRTNGPAFTHVSLPGGLPAAGSIASTECPLDLHSGPSLRKASDQRSPHIGNQEGGKRKQREVRLAAGVQKRVATRPLL